MSVEYHIEKSIAYLIEHCVGTSKSGPFYVGVVYTNNNIRLSENTFGQYCITSDIMKWKIIKRCNAINEMFENIQVGKY